MSRSGYSTDCDGDLVFNLYRANVHRAIQGARGQKFLRELAGIMDAMPAKELISGDLVTEQGACALGTVVVARGLELDPEADWGDPDNAAALGRKLGIAECMVREIEFENDGDWAYWRRVSDETPADRWARMRNWVRSHICT